MKWVNGCMVSTIWRRASFPVSVAIGHGHTVLTTLKLFLVRFISCNVNQKLRESDFGHGKAVKFCSVFWRGGVRGGQLYQNSCFRCTFNSGISNTFGTIPGIISPYLVGRLTSGPLGHSASQWRLVFYISAVIYMSTATFFGFTASSELESWEREEVPLLTEALN